MEILEILLNGFMMSVSGGVYKGERNTTHDKHVTDVEAT